jgi:hypothetical protein
MLQRQSPTLFQATTGETVTIAAIARNNGGAEAAIFRYGSPQQLPPRVVQGHPGCEFNVRSATNTLGALVTFATGSPTAQYELFEEDDNGILQPLQIVATPLSGAIVQFQIVGIPAVLPLPLPPPPPLSLDVPETADVAKGVAKKAAKKTVKKAARKVAKKVARKAAKKTAKKTVKKAAKKGVKKAARRAVGKATKKAARKVAKPTTKAAKTGSKAMKATKKRNKRRSR